MNPANPSSFEQSHQYHLAVWMGVDQIQNLEFKAGAGHK